VPFPDDVLTDQEEVVLHLHPHAKAAVRPILVLALMLAAVIVSWVMLPSNRGGLIGVLVVGAFALYLGVRHGIAPLVVWRTTHYVVTDERILLQEGVVTRERRDLPLARVNDHALTQSLLDRIFGCGTLTVDSIGDQAAVLRSIPHVHRVQTLLYELIEHAPEPEPEDEIHLLLSDDPPAAGRPAPKQARRRGRAAR
jgi:uncharacterized membrane protein YdbT with pleckstrin-like domain